MQDAQIYRAINLADLLEREFKKSPNGPTSHLMAKAVTGAINATRELLEVDPHDWASVQRLQNEVRRFQDMARWIGEAVSDGDAAYQELSEEERAELLQALGMEIDT